MSMEAETLTRVGVPLSLGFLYLVVERRHNERARLDARVRDLRAAKAIQARLASGCRILRVRVVGESGKPVNLGSSTEDPQGISGRPTLQTEQLTLRADDGRIFSVPAGRRMRIEALPGARRNVVDTVTTGSGVEQRYSFELTPEQPFEIFGIPPPRAAEAGPFRTADAAEVLAPCESEYVAGASLRSLTEPPSDTTPLVEHYWSWAVGGTLLGCVVWNVPEAGALLWGAAVAVGVLWTAVMWFTAESVDASSSELEELQRRR
jgi:hypothetical protein